MTKDSKGDSGRSGRILRMSDLPAHTGLGRSSLYALMKEEGPKYDPTFPKAIVLSDRVRGYDRVEIDAWVEKRKTHGRDSKELTEAKPIEPPVQIPEPETHKKTVVVIKEPQIPTTKEVEAPKKEARVAQDFAAWFKPYGENPLPPPDKVFKSDYSDVRTTKKTPDGKFIRLFYEDEATGEIFEGMAVTAEEFAKNHVPVSRPPRKRNHPPQGDINELLKNSKKVIIPRK